MLPAKEFMMQRIIYALIIVLLTLLSASLTAAQDTTPPLEQSAARCILPEATPEAIVDAIAETTPEVSDESAVPLLRTLSFEPYDIRFNPNAEQPFAVVMNFTLEFENTLAVPLNVRRPQFELAIEGVEWGELVSTDFQMGRIQAGAKYGIALQNLTLVNKATETQKAVLACIAERIPVDLHVSGSIEALPGEQAERVPLDVFVGAVVFDHDQ